MDDKKRLPDAELAVMQAIWAVGGEVSRGDLDAGVPRLERQHRQHLPYSPVRKKIPLEPPRGAEQFVHAARLKGQIPRI